MGSHSVDGEASSSAQHRRGLSFALAVGVHLLGLWALAYSISFQFPELPERVVEPKIVALAPRIVPPPPDVETLGPTDVTITTQPRFRPRIPTVTRERQSGDPALAVWKYLCNRDMALSEATRRACLEFHFGEFDFGLLDPLNRNGDVGALLGPDTATMSLEEIGRAKRWAKPKMPWSKDGARAQGDSLGLPGHDPFAILP